VSEPAIDRIPIAHSVRYVARGLPEVPNQYGPGVLAPSEITLTYRPVPDPQLGRVHAYVAGRIWVDGVELPLLPGGLYGQHYDDGLDGWPAWLAEEARLHDPAGQAPATDRPGTRFSPDEGVHGRDPYYADGNRTAVPTVWIDGHPELEAIAAAVHEQCEHSDSGLVIDDPRNIAVAALAAVLSAPVDRAAVYREIADRQTQLAVADDLARRRDMAAARRQLVKELRRMAAAPAAVSAVPGQADSAAQVGCTCSHPTDEHSVYGCTDGRGCEWMPKKPPMNPWRILGIADCPTPLTHNWGCGCPTDQLPLHAESGVDTPGCDCGHAGMGPKWHLKACTWVATLTVPHPNDVAAEQPAAGAQQPKEARP
jgi:hypothetical protein